MSNHDLTEVIRGLRDTVLETARHPDREAPGTEMFEALTRALAARGEPAPAVDLALHDAVARRMAWGDREEDVLSDAEQVFDRLLAAVERAVSDPDEQLVVVALATDVAAAVARVVALAAVGRASRARTTRMREEMSHRQLRDVLDKQQQAIARLERELGQPG